MHSSVVRGQEPVCEVRTERPHACFQGISIWFIEAWGGLTAHFGIPVIFVKSSEEAEEVEERRIKSAYGREEKERILTKSRLRSEGTNTTGKDEERPWV